MQSIARVTAGFHRVQVRSPDGTVLGIDGCELCDLKRARRLARGLRELLASEWQADARRLSRRTWRELESLGLDPAACRVEVARPAAPGERHEHGYAVVLSLPVSRVARTS